LHQEASTRRLVCPSLLADARTRQVELSSV
jgi:hypothetical protein